MDVHDVQTNRLKIVIDYPNQIVWREAYTVAAMYKEESSYIRASLPGLYAKMGTHISEPVCPGCMLGGEPIYQS